jgi:hypothetical protein
MKFSRFMMYPCCIDLLIVTYSRPPSNKSVKTPSYEEMLERKRREEASYRRYDDPEYSRSGGE